MTPLVNSGINLKWCDALRHLRNDGFGAAFIQLFDDPIHVERLIAEQGVELDTLKERRDADRVVAMVRQKFETREITTCVGECQDLGRQFAFRLAYGLALSPPSAPCL